MSLGLAAFARPPVTANGTFTDPHPRDPASAAAAPGSRCQVKVTELKDARRAPETLGVVAGRAVRSPEDTAAWLHSIMLGLEPRGLDVTFDNDAAVPIAVQLSLQTAWVTAVSTNKTANVVLHVRATRNGAPDLDRDYRGGLTKMNWNSDQNELKSLVDKAIANALDQVAADLGKLCAEAP